MNRTYFFKSGGIHGIQTLRRAFCGALGQTWRRGLHRRNSQAAAKGGPVETVETVDRQSEHP